MIYLIHFDRALGRAGHYLGSCEDDELEEHMQRNIAGCGEAKPLRRAMAANIGWTVVRLWRGGRVRERQLKRQGSRARLCPMCRHWKRPSRLKED